MKHKQMGGIIVKDCGNRIILTLMHQIGCSGPYAVELLTLQSLRMNDKTINNHFFNNHCLQTTQNSTCGCSLQIVPKIPKNKTPKSH